MIKFILTPHLENEQILAVPAKEIAQDLIKYEEKSIRGIWRHSCFKRCKNCYANKKGTYINLTGNSKYPQQEVEMF